MLLKPMIRMARNVSLHRHHASYRLISQALSEGTLRQNRVEPCSTVARWATGGHAC